MSRGGEPSAVRLAVASLGTTAATCSAGILLLAFNGRDVPDALATIAGGAVGALATLLTNYIPAPVPGGRRAFDPPPDGPPVAPAATAPAVTGGTVSTTPPGPPPNSG